MPGGGRVATLKTMALDSSRPPGADAGRLRHVCDPAAIPFETTAELAPSNDELGQPRAREAVALATAIEDGGYNVFATGQPGTGKGTRVEEWLRIHARKQETPSDIVYLYRFDDPLRPHAFALPAGSGGDFAHEVAQLVDDGRRRITEAFGSESYRARHRAVHEEIDRRRAELLGALEERAKAAGIALQLTPAGVMSVPMAGGRPLTPDEVRDLPEDARHRHEAAVEELKPAVDDTFAAVMELDRTGRERHVDLNREVSLFAIGHLVDAAKRRWQHVDGLAAWLDALREDAIAHLDLFRGSQPGEETPVNPLQRMTGGDGEFLDRYVVNVLVTHEPGSGAPVVALSDPSFFDLFGRAEYETTFGAAVTDHRHLRAGAVHEASGGYLVVEATDLLRTPFAWQRLKDVLRTKQIKIENPATQYMMFPGVTLDPMPVEARITVVLVGQPQLYRLLHAVDEDLARLFKIRADFDTEMARDELGVRAYGALLADVARDTGLPPFDRGAVAALVEHGSRVAGHQQRLTASVRDIADVATEAAHTARTQGAELVAAAHVTAALHAQRRRSDLIEHRLRAEIIEGTLRVEVSGSAVGQVNGLAVALLGDHAFGHPVRISAIASPGEGQVVDIDREAELSGPLHDKGFLILGGFLAGRFCGTAALSLRASVVLEQSYGPIDGDSASAAELVALLSALAELPVDQDIAMTGSVDQHGHIQAIGGANEKIEGFFALCRDLGLTGEQGV